MVNDESMDEALKDKASELMVKIQFFYIIQQMKSREKFSGFEISKLGILWLLTYSGSYSMSDLGNLIYQSKSYMSKLVDALIDEGMVERIPSQNDRRIINLRITDAGIAKVKQMHLDHIKSLKLLINDLQTPDLREICDCSQKIYDILVKIEQSDMMKHFM